MTGALSQEEQDKLAFRTVEAEGVITRSFEPLGPAAGDGTDDDLRNLLGTEDGPSVVVLNEGKHLSQSDVQRLVGCTLWA